MLRLKLFCKRQGDSACMYVFPGRWLYKAGRGRHQLFLEKRHHVLIARKTVGCTAEGAAGETTHVLFLSKPQREGNRASFWGQGTGNVVHAYLDREGVGVEELGHLRKNPDVPVFEEGRVVRWPRAHVHGVRSAGCPSRADEVGLVEHVFVPGKPARRTVLGYEDKKLFMLDQCDFLRARVSLGYVEGQAPIENRACLATSPPSATASRTCTRM